MVCERLSGLTLILLGIAITEVVRAQSPVPTLINYQGRLVDASGVPLETENRDLSLQIFDAPTGGTLVYGPQSMPSTPIVNGYYNVLLGPVDEANPGRAIETAFSGSERYLEVTVGGVVMSPRQRILSAPYAIQSLNAVNAQTADGVAEGGVTSLMIAPNAVDSSRIAPNAVGSAQIAANAVASSEIANGAVLTEKLAAGAVTTAVIANGAVGELQLQNGAVSTVKFAPGAVAPLALKVTGPLPVQTSQILTALSLPNTVPVVMQVVNELTATLQLTGTRPVWVGLQGHPSISAGGATCRVQGGTVYIEIYRGAERVHRFQIGSSSTSAIVDFPIESLNFVDIPASGGNVTYSVRAGAKEWDTGTFVQASLRETQLVAFEL